MRSASAGVDAPTREGQQLGPARPDLVRQPEVPAGVDAHPHLRLGQREQGVLGRHPDVGHEHELEAEAEAVALHGGHDRLGQLGEDLEALVGPADALVVIARLLGRGATRDPVLGHAQVDAGAEGPALGLDQQDADAVVEADPVGQDAQLPGGLPRPHVELLGVVERQGADARAVVGHVQAELPVLLGEHRFGADGHGWVLLPCVPAGRLRPAGRICRIGR